MAVYTKLRRRRILRLYADSSCYQDWTLVQVWTIREGEPVPVKRFISDLIADRGLPEILNMVLAEAEAETNHHAPISFWP
jgi:hypothetical protein